MVIDTDQIRFKTFVQKIIMISASRDNTQMSVQVDVNIGCIEVGKVYRAKNPILFFVCAS